MSLTAAPASVPEEGQVIAKAMLNAAEALGMKGRELYAILGTSESKLSRLRRAPGKAELRDPKERELALLFLRVFRSLDALVGGDEQKAAAWLRANNHHLGGVPIERMKQVAGLVHVAEYLDAMRGKV